MSDPGVGVVIPARNGERYLGAAIESVLAQTHRALDVVVVDDGSIDATREVAGRYAPEVVCIAAPHAGLGAAKNAGVPVAGGDFVAFLDQDDLWTPAKLELQLAAFDGDPSLDLVFGGVREFISPDLGSNAAAKLRCAGESRPAKLPGSLLARRTALRRVGPFATHWVTNDFMAWLLAARERGVRERIVSDHVLWRRLHDANASLRADVCRREYTYVIKESLDRRRAGAARRAVMPSKGRGRSAT